MQIFFSRPINVPLWQNICSYTNKSSQSVRILVKHGRRFCPDIKNVEHGGVVLINQGLLCHLDTSGKLFRKINTTLNPWITLQPPNIYPQSMFGAKLLQISFSK